MKKAIDIKNCISVEVFQINGNISCHLNTQSSVSASGFLERMRRLPKVYSSWEAPYDGVAAILVIEAPPKKFKQQIMEVRKAIRELEDQFAHP